MYSLFWDFWNRTVSLYTHIHRAHAPYTHATRHSHTPTSNCAHPYAQIMHQSINNARRLFTRAILPKVSWKIKTQMFKAHIQVTFHAPSWIQLPTSVRKLTALFSVTFSDFGHRYFAMSKWVAAVTQSFICKSVLDVLSSASMYSTFMLARFRLPISERQHRAKTNVKRTICNEARKCSIHQPHNDLDFLVVVKKSPRESRRRTKEKLRPYRTAQKRYSLNFGSWCG